MSVGIVGGGVMGEVLLSGLLRNDTPAREVLVCEKRAERADQLQTQYDVRVVDDLAEVAGCETIALVVKPQDMGSVLEQLGSRVNSGQLVVSLAAGITSGFVEKRLPAGVPVVRVMPNTPALVGQGMAAISAGTHATDEHLARTEQMLSATGKVVRVPESQQDIVTAVSGSGPAYFFQVVESMVEAAVLLGLTRPVATELVVQTLVGAGAMLRESGEHPGTLRERVTSPGGTTAAALRKLDDHGVKSAFIAAMEAARDRSAELAGDD